MKPLTEHDRMVALLTHGQVFIFETYDIDKNEVKRFLLDPEEVILKELQDDKQKS